jgi:hypothetical protein
MKTHYLILLLSFFFASVIVNGQSQQFDLGKYVNPDYKRQQLNFNLNFNGNTDYQKNSQGSTDYNNTNKQMNGLVSAYYLNFTNSLTLQRNWSLSIQESRSVYDQQSTYENNLGDYKNINQNKSISNSLNLNVNSSERHYFGNRNFFEIDLTGGYSNRYSKYHSKSSYWSTDTTTSETDQKTTNLTILGNIGFRIGRGRIESVEDARLAIYILDDMQKHGRLKRDLTDDEIINFSQTITQIKNKRFFDTRLRKIEEITKIDSFMRANNLITSNDATYFTLLNDNWDNASGPARMSGYRYSFGINPEYYRNNNNFNNSTSTPSEHNIKYFNYGLSADGRLDYEKPLSLYWQFTGSIMLKYTILKGKAEESDNPDINLHLNEFSSEIFAKIGFFPNSRTSLNSSIGIRYRNSKAINGIVNSALPDINGSSNYIDPYFSLSTYYYVSQRLRLQINYSMIYAVSKEKDDFDYYRQYYYNNYPLGKRFNNSLNISVTYMLF